MTIGHLEYTGDDVVCPGPSRWTHLRTKYKLVYGF